jgi:hypothetical protein
MNIENGSRFRYQRQVCLVKLRFFEATIKEID